MNCKVIRKELEQKNKALGIESIRRKQAEMALQEAEQITDAMINNTEVMFAYMDSAFNLIKVNRTYAEAYGHAPSFFSGKSYFDLYPNDKNNSLFQNIIATGEPVYHYAKPFECAEDPEQSTTYWDWSILPVKNHSGRVDGIILYLVNVTKRVHTEEELKNNHYYLEKLHNALKDCVFTIGMPERKIEYVNSSVQHMFGYSIEESIGSTTSLFYPDNEGYLDFGKKLQHSIEQGAEFFHTEQVLKRKNGELFISEITLTFFKESDGFTTGCISIIRDISKKKAIEAQIRQYQKMEAVGTLTAGIAHEFNNLLVPICGYADLLIGRKAANDSDLSQLEHIKFAGKRAKALVQQLLAYARKSMSSSELLQLDLLVKGASQFIKNTLPPNISIKHEIEMGLPLIKGMSNEIHQIILNLCINACHAMPAGGELAIRLKNAGSHYYLNSAGKEGKGDFIDLSVHDTGTGMDQNVLDRIFDPFFTTKDIGQGSGLGLSVVQGIVEQHEGHIAIESTVGEGTAFHVYFPVAQGTIKRSLTKTKTLPLGNERILLIDDDREVVELTKSMMEESGYRVADFLDSVEALTQFSERPQDFDLVITDYGMPKMNGKKLAEKLKEIRPDIPIILFTGYGDLVLGEDVDTWGMDGILLKPFESNQLFEVVCEVLTKSTAGKGKNSEIRNAR